MSAPVDVLAVKLTPKRREWLEHLVKHGETSWSRMPRDAGGKRHCTNGTWWPMEKAGWIVSRMGGRYGNDRLFYITERGRSFLARIGGAQ